MDWIFNSEIWVALFTLATLEFVLGVDNLVCLVAEPSLEPLSAIRTSPCMCCARRPCAKDARCRR